MAGKKKDFTRTIAHTLQHVYKRATQTQFVYKQVVPHRSNMIKNGEVHTIYVNKDFAVNVLGAERGVPPLIEVTIRGIYPEDEESE